MKPRLFTLAAAVSLVMCIATVGLWVRSYSFGTFLFVASDHRGGTRSMAIGAVDGILYANDVFRPELPYEPISTGIPFLGWDWYFEPHEAPIITLPAGHWFGFALASGQYGNNRVETAVKEASVPLWVPTSLWMIVPSSWVVYARRQGGGLCPTCGYDLRATPDRCPECGKVPAVQ